MRLCILPITSFRHLKGESEIVMWTNMIRQWTEEHPDCWIYMILPEDTREQGWDGMQFPRTTALWIDRLGLYYDKLTDLPATFLDTFNLRNGRYQLDGLITSRRAAVIGLAREMWDHRLKTSLPVIIEEGVTAYEERPISIPIFVDESMTVNRGQTAATVSDIEMMAQTLGYAYGWPIWDTEVQRRNGLDAARHFLSGHQALQALKKGVVIPCGFEPDKMDRIIGDRVPEADKWVGAEGRGARQNGYPGKQSRFTCIFGGRLNRGTKRADVMLREFDSLFKFGRDVSITVCSPKEEGWMLEMIEKMYPEINVLVQTASMEFKRRAARAHVFMNTSAHEGFSVGFSEMMYMTKYGTVLIAPRAPWVAGMLKEEFERYPFLYQDFEQARVMLRWVHEHYEEAVRKTSYLGDWTREQYDGKRTNEEHWQHFQKVTEHELNNELIRGLMSESNRELVLASLKKMPTEFTINALYQKMIDNSRAMKDDPRRGQTTKFAVRRWLMNEKYAQDLYDSPHTRMRKI